MSAEICFDIQRMLTTNFGSVTSNFDPSYARNPGDISRRPSSPELHPEDETIRVYDNFTTSII
jgi:hypothetical protein